MFISESHEMLGLINFFVKMDCLMEKSTVFGWLFEMIMGKITLFDLAMIEEIFFPSIDVRSLGLS